MNVLAADLGGTQIKLGLLEGGRLSASDALPSHSDRGLLERLPALKEAFARLAASRGLALGAFEGVALAVPFLVDPKSGEILAQFGKFTDAPGLDLRSWSRRELGLPLALENDARMALAGEWKHGSGRGADNLVMMTLGTGIGTAAVVDGRLVRGRHSQAGSLAGHMVVSLGGRSCGCGNPGCAEAEASTASLPDLARRWPGFGDSALSREGAINFERVFGLASGGDPVAQGLVDRCLRVWSTLAVNLVLAYDPERLILGGGVMASASVIVPALQRHLEERTQNAVQVVPAELGNHAALHAGEWLLQEQRSLHCA